MGVAEGEPCCLHIVTKKRKLYTYASQAPLKSLAHLVVKSQLVITPQMQSSVLFLEKENLFLAKLQL